MAALLEDSVYVEGLSVSCLRLSPPRSYKCGDTVLESFSGTKYSTHDLDTPSSLRVGMGSFCRSAVRPASLAPGSAFEDSSVPPWTLEPQG